MKENSGRERRAPGARVAAHFMVRVTWVASADSAVQECHGRVQNVSPSGVLLVLNCSPDAGQDVFIHAAPAGEREVGEETQLTFPAQTLWTEPHGDGEAKAAFELDFTEESGKYHMRRWMESVYEPLALTVALEGEEEKF